MTNKIEYCLEFNRLSILVVRRPILRTTTLLFCLLLSPVASCSCSVAALADAWSGVGAELGPGPGFRATERGAGREAVREEGKEAFRVAGGFTVFELLLLLLSGLPSVFTVLLFTHEEVEPP